MKATLPRTIRIGAMITFVVALLAFVVRSS
jgi:hypothetical protein